MLSHAAPALASFCNTLVPGSVTWPPEPALTLLALDTLWLQRGGLLCGWCGSASGSGSVHRSAGGAGAGTDIRLELGVGAAHVHCQASLATKPAAAGYTLHRTTMLADRFLAL